MKKLKPSIKRKLSALDTKQIRINSDYDRIVNSLATRYDIDPQNPDIDSENYADYVSWKNRAYANLVWQTERLGAERAALLLIGYNIARRGKPLHEKNVLKKTQKLGLDGYIMRRQIQHPCITDYHLYDALKKRGITLLDTNSFRMIMARLDELNPARYSDRREIDRYEKQLNMFHKSLEYKLSQQKTK